MEQSFQQSSCVLKKVSSGTVLPTEFTCCLESQTYRPPPPGEGGGALHSIPPEGAKASLEPL